MPFENVLLEKAREGSRRLEIVDATEGIEKRKMDAPCCARPPVTATITRDRRASPIRTSGFRRRC